MTTNNFHKTDLYGIHSVVQNSMIFYPKEIISSALKNFFAADKEYHYVKDLWGYAYTPDHTDLPRTAGYADDLTTRVFIGENNRFDAIYFPAILIRHGGSSSTPISMNRETSSVQWDWLIYEDGYGNVKKFKHPTHFIYAGAWEGSINIEVKAKDIRSRDDLVDLVSLFFVDIGFNDLVKSGVVVKGVSVSSAADQEDGANKLFIQTVTLQIRSEWRRHVPVGNIVEIINASIEFGRIEGSLPPPAPNLTINIRKTLIDMLDNL